MRREWSKPSASSPVVSDVSGHKELLKDFLRAIETDGRPYCDGVEARRSVALVQAIYESARTGRSYALANETDCPIVGPTSRLSGSPTTATAHTKTRSFMRTTPILMSF